MVACFALINSLWYPDQNEGGGGIGLALWPRFALSLSLSVFVSVVYHVLTLGVCGDPHDVSGVYMALHRAQCNHCQYLFTACPHWAGLRAFPPISDGCASAGPANSLLCRVCTHHLLPYHPLCGNGWHWLWRSVSARSHDHSPDLYVMCSLQCSSPATMACRACCHSATHRR